MKLRDNQEFTKSDNYRSQIHDLIPGGAHTYSKGDDQFPLKSPAAISHGKGAYVWDLDGNQYLDCSMGLTSVSLGHAYEPVLKEVRKELEKGVNFQRPSVLEKNMAEEFLGLVPQHDMIKFAKNGSTITTAAIKLARAATGRNLVAFPGDHPFYSYDDWFIGSTECNAGVPEEITNLSITFNGCDIDSLKTLFDKYPDQIACVITEPEKGPCSINCNCGSNPKAFLPEAIELTHKNGALFIIDEMVTGFKTAFPGSITKFNLDADMATWGKGIANGFSFCALTGKKEVMDLGGIRNKGSERVFLISSTHGGETHAMAASIATINEFKNSDIISKNHKLGDRLIVGINNVINSKSLQEYIAVIPCNWLPIFTFRDNAGTISTGMRTLMMQEMIKKGVLFQGAFVPCYSHSADDIDYFIKAFELCSDIYLEALEKGYEGFLIGDTVQPVFRKYN